ncbi:cobalamin B12-binding domain-containing protein [Halalkalibacillus sediminis]|nr:cobalamin-dependent protein [Halalkalibacillus sediminis]
MDKYKKAYMKAITDGDIQSAQDIISKSLEDDYSLDDIYSMIASSMYDIGNSWQFNDISVAQEHFSTAISQTIISQLGLQKMPVDYERRKETAALFSVETNAHSLGIQMIQNIFQHFGYRTYYFGADLPNAHIIKELKKIKPNYIAFSITLSDHALAAIELSQMIRDENELSDTKIIIGGYAFHNRAELKDHIEHDYYFQNVSDFNDWLSEKDR